MVARITRWMDPGPRSLKERLIYTVFSAALGALAARLGQRVAEVIWERSTGGRAPQHFKPAFPAGTRLGERAAGFLAGRSRLFSRR